MFGYIITGLVHFIFSKSGIEVLVPHINGTGYPVSVMVLQKYKFHLWFNKYQIRSGFH